MGQICFGSNDSRINPHMRAKFSCGQTVLSKKSGVQTDRQTDTQRDTALYFASMDINFMKNFCAASLIDDLLPF